MNKPRIILNVLLIALILAAGNPLAGAAVLFSEDFEDQNLAARGWYDIEGLPGDMSITASQFSTGTHSLQFRYPAASTGDFWMHHPFPAQDLVYARCYRRFEASWEWTGHSYGPHDLYLFAGEYWWPTDTDLTIYMEENEGRPRLTIKDKLQGGHFGEWGTDYNQNTGTPVYFLNDRWYCLEVMARMNTPYQSNGEVRMWVDGQLVILLQNLKLRDDQHTTIQFDHLMLGPYFHEGTPQVQSCWLDSLAAATEYIGPCEGTPPAEVIGVSLACQPASGVLPFSEGFSVTLDNLSAGFVRTIACRIDVTAAGGQFFGGWRSGYVNVSPSGSFCTQFAMSLPALDSLAGNNEFRLLGRDVTASPYNQPPYPASGDTDSDVCTVSGLAP